MTLHLNQTNLRCSFIDKKAVAEAGYEPRASISRGNIVNHNVTTTYFLFNAKNTTFEKLFS